MFSHADSALHVQLLSTYNTFVNVLLLKTEKSHLCLTSSSVSLPPPVHPGGPAPDPGEARAQPCGPEEAGGDQGVLAGPREHHPGQSPPAL